MGLLEFFDDVEGGVEDELVEVVGLVSEVGVVVVVGFGGVEFMFEEGGVEGGEDGEVVGYFFGFCLVGGIGG